MENETLKEGSGSDKELRLEDYMDVTDLDKMVTEITKQDASAMPTILDYADKPKASPGGTPEMKKVQRSVNTLQARPHSSSSF